MAQPRPDPDELLRRVQAAEKKLGRGRLTVFFGAAPGVGKTFAMLEEASYQRDVEGRDVVAGVVETHGRFETTTLLAGFKRLPKKQFEHRGTTIDEFDLDAALARKPSLLLLDELAHTNAEGSRHPKRWQDVDELLDAGIDVFTTLNVQHVESVNDVVARITGVVVRETVPDAVIDGADEIKLIDLPPDELLDRMREGKVYVPAQAERAMQSFFRKGNLIALRELALRRTAERVDAEMQEYRREHGIEKTWAASDRLMVCISPSPFSANLIRAGRRMAANLRAAWFAVNVETPATLRLGPEDRARISRHLRFAEQLGAEAVTLTGERAAEEILRFARERNLTKIVVGKPRGRSLRDRLTASFVDELILGSGDIDVYVTAGETELSEPTPAARPLPATERPLAGYLAVVGMVVMASVVAGLFFGRGDLADIVMTYLLGLVLISMRFGFRVAIVGAVLSVLAYDFFFIPPYLTFTVGDLRHVVTFGVMLFVAVVIAGLTQRVRDQVNVARKNQHRTAILHAMSRDLTRAEGLDAVLNVAAPHVERFFECRVAAFFPQPNGELDMTYATAGFDGLSESESGHVRWVWNNRREAGVGTNSLAGGRALYLPLGASGGDKLVGVLGLFPNEPKRFEDPEQRRLAEAFASQLAVALERAELAVATEHARLEVETERLRSTLLSSVSHDLRTPLAVMKGSASTLLDADAKLDPSMRRELVQALLEETERLERLVRNLLDMTRLESGALALHKEWQSVEEAVGAALNRVESRLGSRRVETHVPGDLLAPFDAVLMEQVLVNLLENALKYTPEGSPIEVNAEATNDEVTIEVADRGPGIPTGEEAQIFEKFRRGPGVGAAGGVGLGLTICRAIVGAHGGRIWAENRPGGGASFKFVLALTGERPIAALPEISDKVAS